MPHRLRRKLLPLEASTTQYMGWSAVRNGKLLTAAEEGGFQVLLTGDQTLTSEQKIEGRNIGVVVLSSVEYPRIEPHIDEIRRAIEQVKPGKVLFVSCGIFRRSSPG